MPAPIRAWGFNTPVYDGCTYLLQQCPALCAVSPNAITVGGLCLGLGVAYGLARGSPWGLLVLGAVLRELLDIADGVVARQCQKTSRFGALLDIVCDLLYLVAVTVAVVYRAWPLRTVVAWGMLASCLVACGFLTVELTSEVQHRPKPQGDGWVARNSIIAVPAFVAVLRHVM